MKKKINSYFKEGSIGDNINAVITLVAGIGVASLVLIFVGTLGGQTYNLVEDDIDSLSHLSGNDTVTVLNQTWVALDHDDVVENTVSIFNDSHVVNLENFSINYDDGLVKLLGANGIYNNSVLTFQYTYGNPDIQGHIKNSILSSFTGVQETGDYLPIIVLAFAITLIMALVLTNFSVGGNYKGGAL